MTITSLTTLALLCFMALAAPVGAQQPGGAADPEATARAFVDLLSSGLFQQTVVQFTPQMAAALPVDRLAATWNGLVTQAGTFRRVLSASSAAGGALSVVALTCEFARATWIVRVTIDGQGRVAGLFFQPAAAPFSYSPPPYATPAKYTEREVTVGKAPWTLPATLTMPVGDGPFPAVVLVHGSGPGDRDETVGKNKPFEDLALGLASRGIAVLRYEKRTRQYAGLLRNAPNFTVKDETIDDAVAAAELLRHESRVDPRRVFVLGHSLGAMLVPRIGTADSQLAGFIVMAGPARPIEQAIVDQVRYLAMADGTVTPEEQSQIDQVMAVADRIRSLTPADAKDPSLILGAPASYWLDLRGYDPPAAAARLAQPLLVLQGERDYQVTMDEFAKWKTALASKSNATLRSFPGLNHLFISGTAKSLPADYDSPGHVSEDVVVAIASWIAKP
jgi:dienelactone hydrolase